jgi:WD40 repeat protein
VMTSFQLPQPVSFAVGIAYSQDGRTIALDTGTGTVLLCDSRSHRITGRILASRTPGALTLTFSPDGQTLATAGADNTVRLWQMRTRSLAGVIGPETTRVHDLAFSPDGRLLAGASLDDATVRLWDVTTKQLAFSLTAYPLIVGNQVEPLDVNQIAFGPLGSNLLITTLDNGTAQVWDLSTADQVRRICATIGTANVASAWRQLSPAPGPDPCTG